MKRCQKCGYENSDGMIYCLQCGAALHEAPMVVNLGGNDSSSQSDSAPTVFGATHPSNFGSDPQSNFGANQPNFGANQANSGPNQPNFTPSHFSQPPSKPKSNLGLIIGGVAALVLLLGVAGAAIVAYNIFIPKPPVSPTPTVSPTPAISPISGIDKTPSPKTSTSPQISPTPATSNTPQASFTPPTVPTKSGSFTVYANTGWQLSNIDVVASEKFRTSIQGSIDLVGIKASVTSSGVNDAKTVSRRIYPEFPTGALLMRTRYADGKTSNTVAMTANGANGSWQNYPYEIGKLEFCINDNAPEQNGGQFIVTKTSTSAPQTKK